MRIGRVLPPVAGVYLPLAGGTMTGDIQMGANNIRTTDLQIRQADVDTLAVANVAYTLFKNWAVFALRFASALLADALDVSLQAQNVDNALIRLYARDNGAGLIEIARIQGAADPYFQATLPMRLLPIATAVLPPAAPEGSLTYDNTLKRLTMHNATEWRSVLDQFAVGTLLVASADTAGNSPPLAATKKKEIVVPSNGAFTIKYDFISKDAGHGIYAQVYRNGVAQGSESEETTFGWSTVTSNFAGWESGDLCQLYVRYKTATDAGSGWRNFRLYAAVDVHKFTVNLDT